MGNLAILIMPFLIPLSALIAGILLEDYLEGPVWGFIPVAFALGLYLFILLRSKTPLNAFKLNPFHKIWVFLLFSGIGYFAAFYHKPDVLDQTELNSVVGAEGEVIESKAYARGDVLKVQLYNLIFKSGETRECKNLKILLSTDGFSTKRGDIIIFKGILSPISDDPNYHSDGYADRMNRKGYIYRAKAASDDISLKGYNNSIYARSESWRDKIGIALEKSSLARQTSDFIAALLLADRSSLRQDVKDSFSNAGVAHMLALSGMHVAIIMGIIMGIFFPLAMAGWNIPRYWISVAGIWGFAFLTGLSPSTFRACVMATFVVISITFQRRRNAGNALLASSFIIILLDPSAIYDVGLQLSFLSVACILLFASQLNPVNRHSHPKMHAIVSAILVSLVATMGTWVLVSFYFKRIPLLFLPANLILLPLLPLYMSVSILYTGFLMFGTDIRLLSYILDKGYEIFISVIDKIISFGNYTLEFQTTLPVIILWIIGILILGYAINKRKKIAVTVTASLFLIGSVITAPILSSSPADSMIFQKKYDEISMVFYENNNQDKTTFPRNVVSRISRKHSDIISVDCKGFADSLPNWIRSGEELYTTLNKSYKSQKRKKYLLLSSGLGDVSLKDIPGLEKFDRIILHSSIRKKREKALLDEAKKLGLSNMHSLRIDGPLEVEL
ncbi:MAG: ComEC family competence protein [Muribaculaceae bacterium]|nr:ComEC family competence protein [Muribaculaceae bacterium]